MDSDTRISDSFGILNLPEHASLEEVKAAHRRISRELHPDQFVDKPTLASVAEEKLKQVNAAYDFLKREFHFRASDHEAPNSSNPNWKGSTSQQSGTNKKSRPTEKAGTKSRAAGSDQDQAYGRGVKKHWADRIWASLLGRRSPQWVLFPIGFCVVICFVALMDQISSKNQDLVDPLKGSRGIWHAVAKDNTFLPKVDLGGTTELSTGSVDHKMPNQNGSLSLRPKSNPISSPPRLVQLQKSSSSDIPAVKRVAPPKPGFVFDDPTHIYNVGESGASMPVPIYKVQSEATEAARLARHGGVVILSLVVGADGKATEIKVIRSLGMGLDESAIDAVRQWKFNPGLRNGLAVPVRGTINVNFDVCGEDGRPCVNSGNVGSNGTGEERHGDFEKKQATNQVYGVGNGVSPPKVTVKVDPEYSEEARIAGVSGTILLSLVVDSAGRPQKIRVVRGLGFGLNEKAVAAVETWKFEPGMKDDKAVDVRGTIEVHFRLCPSCL